MYIIYQRAIEYIPLPALPLMEIIIPITLRRLIINMQNDSQNEPTFFFKKSGKKYNKIIMF